jgi:type IV secretory pathway TraG/TraD family ATPase VirD4
MLPPRLLHLLFAMTGHAGAGEGQRLILPVLLDFEGPTVVLDPKGENYEHTAWRRSLYGQVFKWAPGVSDSDCYNPLDRVTGWDEARLVAELLVIPQGKEPFWDEAARDLLTGLIFYVIRTRPEGQRNMRAVCRLLTPSKADFEAMVEDLQGSDDERLKELGYMRIIEDAVAITRSYRVRLWLFAQDLAQLEEVYPKWRSLVANCRGQIYFRPNDTRTAEHVAERLGRRKDIWGGEDWVASPQQLMGPEFRDDGVVAEITK